MAHSKNLTWAEVERTVERNARTLLQDINNAENSYQDLLEAFTANGGTDQAFADQLFGATASAEQVEMVSDAKAAMLAMHQLHQALNNIAVSQSDRATLLYRMA